MSEEVPSSQQQQRQSRLLGLPAELREQIWRLVVSPEANRVPGPEDGYETYAYGSALGLLLVNQQVLLEARAAFRSENVFVRIRTPWPEATDHVEVEGHVPVLLRGRRAARFPHHTLSVAIEAPLMGDANGGADADDSDDDSAGDNGGLGGGARSQYFVILLDDLPRFTRTWFYSDLSNPGLNRHLGARLHVRDPYDDGGGHVPVSLQRRLLLPFGDVKNLRQLHVTGDPAPPSETVVEELRAAQAVPTASPERCLDEATRFKAEGNALLLPPAESGREPDPRAALEAYGRAWEAMHIVVRGRRRHVHGEAFFARQLRGKAEGPAEEVGSGVWKGRNGAMERLVLRVQLVANTCLAYLRLRQWNDVVFWGMRSIGMMRQARFAGPVAGHALGADDDSFFLDVDIPPEQEAVMGFAAAKPSKLWEIHCLAQPTCFVTSTTRRS